MTEEIDWHDTYAVDVGERKTPWGWSQHLRVYRRDGADGIPWDDLQHIKNDVLGADVAAVEIYPPQGDLINEANMRHLWTVPTGFLGGDDGIGFGWKL